MCFKMAIEFVKQSGNSGKFDWHSYLLKAVQNGAESFLQNGNELVVVFK
jgi:hypothetical protein